MILVKPKPFPATQRALGYCLAVCSLVQAHYDLSSPNSRPYASPSVKGNPEVENRKLEQNCRPAIPYADEHKTLRFHVPGAWIL